MFENTCMRELTVTNMINKLLVGNGLAPANVPLGA